MIKVFLDTNIFIYASDKNSRWYKISNDLIKYCRREKIALLTSVETFQEIIHFASRIKRLSYGIEIAKKFTEILDEVLMVDHPIIQNYLNFLSKYRTVESRAVLQLCVCLANSLENVITLDNDFKEFKEIAAQTPAEFLKGKKI